MLFMLITSLSASALKIGTPVTPLFNSDDFPPSAVDKKGSVGFEALISPTGNTEWCAITAKSGIPAFDRETCKILLRRRFNPALDPSGKLVYYFYKSVIHWGINAPPNPDISISIAQMPRGLASPAEVHVALLVSDTGAILACNPELSQASDALGDVACQQVEAGWHTEVAKTA